MKNKFNNIVLICIDCLRYDCVSYQKRKKISNRFVKKYLKTPNLDRLEKNSICFNYVFSTAPYTTTAHASLFTGLYPFDHKIREFYYKGQKLSKKFITLAEFFQKEKYSTIAFSDFSSFFYKLDLFRGFQHIYDKDIDFFQDFKKINSKKKFIFLHFFDVHAPYLLSRSDVFSDNSDYYEAVAKIAWRNKIKIRSLFWNRRPYDLWFKLTQKIRNQKKTFLPLYLQAVSKFDQGRFKIYFDFFEKNLDLEKTVFFIFSDHGDGQNEYKNTNSFGHSNHLANDIIRIPLIIHSPAFNKVINDRLISLKDVYLMVKQFLKVVTLEELVQFSNSEDFIYAESWQGPSLFEKRRDGKKHFLFETPNIKKKDYFLFEKSLVTKGKKLILNFKEKRDNFIYSKLNRNFEETKILTQKDYFSKKDLFDINILVKKLSKI